MIHSIRLLDPLLGLAVMEMVLFVAMLVPVLPILAVSCAAGRAVLLVPPLSSYLCIDFFLLVVLLVFVMLHGFR